jgi:hypothetical protein
MNEKFHLPTKYHMLQNLIQVLTMHPLPYEAKEFVIIVMKFMQMQVRKFPIVTSYCLQFSTKPKVIW